jgi:hypothetical protein
MLPAMDEQHGQTQGDSAPADDARPRASPSEILPGDWFHIEYEGRTVLGMIYRTQDGMHTFAYWDQCVLNLATATREQIGAADEEFTALFRGQIAINPNYVEQCVSAWLPKPESAVEEKTTEKEPLPASPEQPGAQKVQKFLFADWDFEAIRATSLPRRPLFLRRGRSGGAK